MDKANRKRIRTAQWHMPNVPFVDCARLRQFGPRGSTQRNRAGKSWKCNMINICEQINLNFNVASRSCDFRVTLFCIAVELRSDVDCVNATVRQQLLYIVHNLVPKPPHNHSR